MHQVRRIGLATALLIVTAFFSATMALAADDPVWAERDPDGAAVGASSGTMTDGSSSGSVVPAGNRSGGSRGGGSGPLCFMVPYAPGTGPAAGTGETVYQRICPSGMGGVTFESGAAVTLGPPAPGGAAPIVVDPLVLAQQAENELVLAEPVVRLNPAEDQIAQLPSWLWLEGGWGEQSASASAGPVTSTVTATPQRVRWSMGNGDELVCGGPGTPYAAQFADTPEATDCSYTYRHSSAGQPGDAYPVTVTVEYGLTWVAVGAPGGGDLGVVEQSSTVPVRVSELQALVQ